MSGRAAAHPRWWSRGRTNVRTYNSGMQQHAPHSDWEIHNGQWEPSPDEIRRQCRVIQRNWTVNEERKRRGLRPLQDHECDWTVPQVSDELVGE